MNNTCEIPIHIVIISAVYHPEPFVSARMGLDLARCLADQKHRVTVVCPQPSRPVNADYHQYTKPGAIVETLEEGVEIVRLPSFAAPASSLIPRLRESWSFGRHVCQSLAKRTLRPDVIYVNAWPLLAQALVIHFAKRNRIPVILQVMDIYPESLLGNFSTILRGILSTPLLKLDAWIAKNAHAVVVISDNMCKSYIESRLIPADRVITIPTWQDETLFEHDVSRADASRRYGIDNSHFTFLYLGNIGPVAGVDLLIRAFLEASIDTAQLVIVGDGSAKEACIDLANRLKASKVHFLSDPDAANVPLLQSMADVCLLPMKRGTGMSSIPSKLQAYMFSAKPVLATVDLDSDTAKAITDAQCGWVGEPGDEGWLIAKMTELASFTEFQLSEHGQRGREYGLLHFSKKKGVERLSQLILDSASAT